MKLRLLQLWDALRSSYWFIPSVMCLLAFILAETLLPIDRLIETKEDSIPRWMYRGSPEGARTVLATIASGMLGVAGVVFSITTVALTLAASQFGPRLMRNFIRDRANQAVLGTFLATFVYCLVVLTSVSASDGNHFTPRVSIAVAVVMALASLAALIYFIHHFATSIQAPEVVNEVSRELLEALDVFLPREAQVENRVPEAETLAAFQEHPAEIVSAGAGYVQAIDTKALQRAAEEHDVTLRALCRAGHFVITGEVIVQVLPPYRLHEDLTAKVREAITLGRLRTTLQDLEFSIDQLVEVAVRALSPGINDPFTAIHCIDLLSEMLGRITHRPLPSPYRFDEAGHLRLITPEAKMANLLDASFNQIRQYGAGSPAVMIRMLEALAAIISQAKRPADLKSLAEHARLVFEAGQANFFADFDKEDLEERYRAIKKRLDQELGENPLPDADEH
jgi:uncharacterized membrane protein